MKVAFISLGCAKNLVNTEQMMALTRDAGYELVSDPEGAEGGGQMAGMGLLPVSTVFRRDKTRTQTAGTFPDCGGFFAPLSGAPLEGYEIHMGTGGGLFSVRDRVLGTYQIGRAHV